MEIGSGLPDAGKRSVVWAGVLHGVGEITGASGRQRHPQCLHGILQTGNAVAGAKRSTDPLGLVPFPGADLVHAETK
jgi:hypothetical protein